MNSLIIYDWDDTLFPTSFIHSGKYINYSQILLIEKQNIKLLNKSRQFGTTIIITNASTEWIYESSKKYMPNLNKYIKYFNIPIYSAREYAAERNIQNYLQWKEITFHNTINNYYRQNARINNILSIGDAVYERNSLLKYGKYINSIIYKHIYIKTIKYIDNPNLNNLYNETTSLLNNLHYHINVKHDLNIDM